MATLPVKQIEKQISMSLQKMGFVVAYTARHICLPERLLGNNTQLVVVAYFPKKACIVVVKAQVHENPTQTYFELYVNGSASMENFLKIDDMLPGYRDQTAFIREYFSLRMINEHNLEKVLDLIKRFHDKGFDLLNEQFKPNSFFLQLTPFHGIDYFTASRNQQKVLDEKYTFEAKSNMPPEFCQAFQ